VQQQEWCRSAARRWTREFTRGYDLVIAVEWGRDQELTQLFPGYTAYFNHLSVTSLGVIGEEVGETACVSCEGNHPKGHVA
jgi:hypothetical protein